MTRPRKSHCKRDSNSGSSALEADALTTRPTRWCTVGNHRYKTKQNKTKIKQSKAKQKESKNKTKDKTNLLRLRKQSSFDLRNTCFKSHNTFIHVCCLTDERNVFIARGTLHSAPLQCKEQPSCSEGRWTKTFCSPVRPELQDRAQA